MKKGRLIETAIILFVLAMGAVGYADFVVTSRGGAGYIFGIDTINKKESSSVAYSTTTKQYYTTVEKALECTESGGTTYVIPGKNPTISRDCVVSSGVTLCLPFYFNINNDVITVGWDGRQTNGSGDTDLGQELLGDEYAKISDSLTSDSTSEYVNKYRRSQVTLDAKLTIENGGTLEIGGVLGHNAGTINGMTTGVYSEISMTSNAMLEVSGELTCLGYIKEKEYSDNGSQVVVKNGGTVTEPMTIFNFLFTQDVTNFTYNSLFPFTQYDFMNIQSKMILNYGSQLNGYWDVYDSKHYSSTLSVIGSSESLFNLKKDAYVDVKYNPYTNELVYWGNSGDTTSIKYSSSNKYDVEAYKGYTNYNFHGDMEFGTANMTFNKDVYSSNYEFPFSYHQQITVDDGTATIGNKYKFLPGSSLTVGTRGTLTQDSSANVVFFQSLPNAMAQDQYDYYYPNIKSGTSILNRARFIVNGTYNLNSGWLGAYIETDNTGATLNFGLSGNLGTSSAEGYAYNNWAGTRKCEKALQSESVTGIMSSDNGIIVSNDSLKSNSTYVSKMNASGVLYWPVVTHVLKFIARKKDYSFGDTGAYFPRFKVYVSIDGTDSTMVSNPIIEEETGKKVDATIETIEHTYDLAEGKWFKIVETKYCNSISDGYQLNKWYKMGTNDITITIQRTVR